MPSGVGCGLDPAITAGRNETKKMNQRHSGPETNSFHFVVVWSRSEWRHEQSQVKQLAVPGAGQGFRVCVTRGTAHVLHSSSVQLWFWTALFDLAQDIFPNGSLYGVFSTSNCAEQEQERSPCVQTFPAQCQSCRHCQHTCKVNNSVPAPAPPLLPAVFHASITAHSPLSRDELHTVRQQCVRAVPQGASSHPKPHPKQSGVLVGWGRQPAQGRWGQVVPKEPGSSLRGQGCSVGEGKPVNNEYGVCLQHCLTQSWETKAGTHTGQVEQGSTAA